MLVTASHTPGFVPSASSIPAKKATTLRCSIIAPFGRPVDPEVKITYARFSRAADEWTLGDSAPASSSMQSARDCDDGGSASRSAVTVTTTRAFVSSIIHAIRLRGYGGSIGT